MSKKENVEEVEVQTIFNKDGLDVLCTEDTIVENIDAEEDE